MPLSALKHVVSGKAPGPDRSASSRCSKNREAWDTPKAPQGPREGMAFQPSRENADSIHAAQSARAASQTGKFTV